MSEISALTLRNMIVTHFVENLLNNIRNKAFQGLEQFRITKLEVLPQRHAGNVSLYLLYASRKFLPAKTRALMEFLERRLNQGL